MYELEVNVKTLYSVKNGPNVDKFILQSKKELDDFCRYHQIIYKEKTNNMGVLLKVSNTEEIPVGVVRRLQEDIV